MKFSEFKYVRLDIKFINEKQIELTNKVNSATTFEETCLAIDEANKMGRDLSTMINISYIRSSINVEDKFYDEERNFLDQNLPLLGETSSNLSKAILESKFIKQLKEKYPPQYFTLSEFDLKCFKPEIVADLQEENRLSTAYSKIIASAQINFDGNNYTLSQLSPFTVSSDRVTRERAIQARVSFYQAHEDEIDKIYDDMVKVRTTIAHKLGYKNFTELGYVRMHRSDYNEEDIKVLRKGVVEYVVPLATKLYEAQAKRLGLDHLRYFDEKYEFKSGNPTPKGDAAWMVGNAKKMYSELSPETGKFFKFMVDHELMDLVSRKGKESGGYCTFIDNYKSPFIFSNFNGTAGDVDVLTHEAGHAFQCYSSQDIDISGLVFPTNESAEIHSMSMEFFTWPWMNLFFKEEVDKYKYSHLGSAITFIPYGTLVDHFQHEVYNNPDMTPLERKATWRRLEKIYQPHKDYQGCDFYDRGGWWFQQHHIFNSPFYYIDYVLAQTCALEFWKKSQDDFKNAWKDYLLLCKQGGKYSFLKLVDIAKLDSPFTEDCLKVVVADIEKWLFSVDQSSF